MGCDIELVHQSVSTDNLFSDTAYSLDSAQSCAGMLHTCSWYGFTVFAVVEHMREWLLACAFEHTSLHKIYQRQQLLESTTHPHASCISHIFNICLNTPGWTNDTQVRAIKCMPSDVCHLQQVEQQSGLRVMHGCRSF